MILARRDGLLADDRSVVPYLKINFPILSKHSAVEAAAFSFRFDWREWNSCLPGLTSQVECALVPACSLLLRWLRLISYGPPLAFDCVFIWLHG